MTPADAIRARAVTLWKRGYNCSSTDGYFPYKCCVSDEDRERRGHVNVEYVALPAPDHAEVMDRVERAERVEKAARALVERFGKFSHCCSCGDTYGHLGNCEVEALRAALAGPRGEG